jgi:hypothetical protein
MAVVELWDLTKRFGPLTAVDRVSLTVACRSLVSRLGPVSVLGLALRVRTFAVAGVTNRLPALSRSGTRLLGAQF